MKIDFCELSDKQKAFTIKWARREYHHLTEKSEMTEQAEKFLSSPEFQEEFFYAQNPDANSFEEFNAEQKYSSFDDYISKNLTEYFNYVFGIETYIIKFTNGSVGDHWDRYRHLDGMTFDASSPEEADKIISDLQEECESGVPDEELWPSDTSLYLCCYQIKVNGDEIPLRDLY